MFNQKEDKKILELKWKEFLDSKRKSRLKRFYSLLQAIKIFCMYMFAFIGASFVMYHFLFGQPYVCTKYNTNSEGSDEPTYCEDIDMRLTECYKESRARTKELMDCQQKNFNLTNSCEDYCIGNILKPTCEDLFGSV